VVVDIGFEFLAQPAALPIRKIIAEIIEERAAANIDVTGKHAAEMADVADIIAGGADGAKEFQRTHDDDENTHGNSDGKREDPDLAVGHQNGHGEKDAVNGAGGTDRRACEQAGAFKMPEDEEAANDHVREAGGDAAREEIDVEAARTPRVFESGAEHGEVEEIEEDVQEAAVEKQVGEGLPEEAADQARRSEAEPIEPEVDARLVKNHGGEELQNKNGDAREADGLYGAREIVANVEAIPVSTRERAHN